MKQQIKTVLGQMVLGLLLLTVLGGHNAFSQDVSKAKVAMKKLDQWIGNWEGEGWQMGESGQRTQFKVEEKIASKLNGLALMVEGVGSGKDGYVGHNAIGMIYYDMNKQIYQFNSVTQDGTSSFTELKINKDGAYVWGFDVPGGKVEFTIEVNEENWVEKGAYSDGTNWYPFLEMNLKKVK